MTENEVVNVVNILNRDIEPGEITWDGQDVLRGRVFKSGAIRPFMRGEALHIAKKIINFEIISTPDPKFSLLRDEKYMEEKMSKIINEIGDVEEEAPVEEEVVLEDLSMQELRRMSKEAGIEQKFGESKKELIKKLKDAK